MSKKENVVEETELVDEENFHGSYKESMFKKLAYMKANLIGLFSSILLLLFLIQMSSKEGFEFRFGGESLKGLGPVFIIMWMHLNQEIVYDAFVNGVAILLAQIYTNSGYSLAACCLIQGSQLQRITFPLMLNSNSSIRSVAWVFSALTIANMLLYIPIIGTSVSMYVYTLSIESGTSSCLVYHQNGSQYDRSHPNLNYAIGNAANSFGTSFGNLKASSNISPTRLIFAPKVTDETENGLRISGSGFQADISSKCKCLFDISQASIVNQGISSSVATEFVQLYNSMNGVPGIIVSLRQVENSVFIESILTGVDVCGAKSGITPPFPLCTTEISNFFNSYISVEYISDDNTVVAIPSRATVREKQNLADIEWLYNGLTYLLGSNLTKFDLLPLYANSVNPLMKWGTTNPQTVDAAKLDVGLEAMIAVLSHTAIQRSFIPKGSRCVKTVDRSDMLLWEISNIGLYFGITFLAIELVFLVLGLVPFFLWLFKVSNPIIPALKFVKNPSDFIALCNQNQSLRIILSKLTVSARNYEFWTKLDIERMIGESIDDSGEIAIGKVGDVKQFKNR